MHCASGHAIVADAPEGLCPACLVGLLTPATTPSQIGPFQVVGVLGEGGFGVVYRARHVTTSEVVAVKVPRRLEFTDAQGFADIERERTVSARLSAEHVVQVLEVGEHAGVPYFAMQHMAGGTLRARMAEYRCAPQRAVELMIRIAAAVQYLHHDPQRPEREPILHRDLKPENILFGADDQPKLSDFGIAKLAKGTIWTLGSRLAGCPAYMAPEQAFPGARRELTAGADVYALGAILYELLTGRPPFEGTDQEILSQLKDREPVRPRRLVPELDPLLEAVVLSALEKDPAWRYRSAAAFAQDLAHALRGKGQENAPSISTPVRLRSWIGHHRLTSAACLWALSLLFVIGIGLRTALTARAQHVEQAQQTNASIAGMQAVAVNLQLRAYKQRVAELSRDPEVLGLVTAGEPTIPSTILQARAASFDTMFVLGVDGRQQARTTQKSREYMARTFSFRDYFRGAQALAAQVCREQRGGGSVAAQQGAYLARAYRSESDGHFEFALSAPLCSGSTWIGVLGATIGTDAVLGAVRLLDDHHGRIAAVLGPRDRERGAASQPPPNDLTFIVHPGLAKGQAQHLLQPEPSLIRGALGISSDPHAAADSDRLRYAAPLRVDQYADPTPGYEGAWSAVFAAADESGYVVAVASRRDSTPLVSVLFDNLALPAGVPFSLGLVVLAIAGLEQLRRAAASTQSRSRRSTEKDWPI
jgi:eukaryotic-like serine/threonine-protein kinase